MTMLPGKAYNGVLITVNDHDLAIGTAEQAAAFVKLIRAMTLADSIYTRTGRDQGVVFVRAEDKCKIEILGNVRIVEDKDAALLEAEFRSIISERRAGPVDEAKA